MPSTEEEAYQTDDCDTFDSILSHAQIVNSRFKMQMISGKWYSQQQLLSFVMKLCDTVLVTWHVRHLSQ